MSKVAHYLQDHLLGEVTVSQDVRQAFSTDCSILQVVPSVVVYPRNENDVRKTARFTWQLAERGRVIPITARGAGTDLSGAALGSGIVLAFPAHMNRILEFDSKSGIVTVEPGINYGKLQQALHTHERFLPPFPSSFEYSTIGGAVGNNAAGEKTVKYGATRDFVKALRVVLANGEVITTGRLNRRDFNKKLGLATFEGEIYRAVDALLDEHSSLLGKLELPISKNAAGYALQDIKRKDGSFDLTPLFVGSQGTLGLITEITLDTEPYNPATTLIVANFDDLQQAQKAVLAIRDHDEVPSAVEVVNDHLLAIVEKLNPNQLKDVVSKPLPRVVLLIEFDNPERTQKKLVKRTAKILDDLAANYHVEVDPVHQERYWKIRHSSAAIVGHTEGGAKALPIIEDGVVPLNKLHEYITGLYEIFARNRLQAALWGHAADANLHMQPFLDLSQVGDRQRLFRVMDEYYDLVLRLGGSTTGEHGDGRLRGPWLPRVYGADVYELFRKVKQVFDPYGTLNPGVKVNVGIDDVKSALRSSYTLGQLYKYMPRS